MIDVIGSDEKVVYIYIYTIHHHFRPENSDHMHYQNFYQEIKKMSIMNMDGKLIKLSIVQRPKHERIRYDSNGIG
jgi:hypothetical protein